MSYDEDPARPSAKALAARKAAEKAERVARIRRLLCGPHGRARRLRKTEKGTYCCHYTRVERSGKHHQRWYHATRGWRRRRRDARRRDLGDLMMLLIEAWPEGSRNL